MTFEERVLRDRALANGENPDDPEVNARIQKELAEQQQESEEASALNTIFDINYTVQEYVEIYKERDKNTLLDVQLRTAFVPQAYYVAVAADRAMFGGKDFFTVKVMKFFMELIKTVVVVDGQLDESEGFAIKMFSLAFQNTKPGDSNGFVFV